MSDTYKPEFLCSCVDLGKGLPDAVDTLEGLGEPYKTYQVYKGMP